MGGDGRGGEGHGKVYTHVQVANRQTCVFDMDMFLHGDVTPMRYLQEPIQRRHHQEWPIVLKVDGHTGTTVGCHVAIGTVGDLVSARRGRGDPGERLDGGGCQGNGGALGLDGVG